MADKYEVDDQVWLDSDEYNLEAGVVTVATIDPADDNLHYLVKDGDGNDSWVKESDLRPLPADGTDIVVDLQRLRSQITHLLDQAVGQIRADERARKDRDETSVPARGVCTQCFGNAQYEPACGFWEHDETPEDKHQPPAIIPMPAEVESEPAF